MKRRLSVFGGAACLALAIGCGPEIDDSPRPSPATPPPGASADAADDVTPKTSAEPPKSSDEQPQGATGGPPAEAKPAEAASEPAATSDSATGADAAAMPNAEKAEAGAGAKGRGYGGGIVTEPVHQYFLVQDRIVFEQQLPHAMDLYKAEHNGKGPATHEKFMKEIIAANSISLPELPPGEKYVYDPKTGELMVQHPAK